jgi:hypothetical protein
VTSCKIRGGRNDFIAGFCPSFFGFLPLIIIPAEHSGRGV